MARTRLAPDHLSLHNMARKSPFSTLACDFTCDSGYHRCGNLCLSDISAQSCGAACSPCTPPANSLPTCDGKACGYTCDVGWLHCTSGCCRAQSLSTGAHHACALTSGGGINCWGLNENGQLGDGSKNNRLRPVSMPDLISGVRAVSSGFGHTCALTNTGGAKCWGRNWEGQLGSAQSSGNQPVDVHGLTTGVRECLS